MSRSQSVAIFRKYPRRGAMSFIDARSPRRLTNRASAAGAELTGAPCARSLYATRQADKRNSSLLGRARQLQALVRPLHST